MRWAYAACKNERGWQWALQQLKIAPAPPADPQFSVFHLPVPAIVFAITDAKRAHGVRLGPFLTADAEKNAPGGFLGALVEMLLLLVSCDHPSRSGFLQAFGLGSREYCTVRACGAFMAISHGTPPDVGTGVPDGAQKDGHAWQGHVRAINWPVRAVTRTPLRAGVHYTYLLLLAIHATILPFSTIRY